MKLWIVLPLLAALVSGCASTVMNLDPTGREFPTVRGESLDAEARELPAHFAGKPVILLVGYVMETQFDIDRWLLGLLQLRTPVACAEVPTIRGMLPGMFAGAIDSGMRSGIPIEDWGAVITLYGSGAKDVVAFTGNERPRNARVLLLDAAGRVAWFHDRGFSPGKLQELDGRARELAAGAAPGARTLFDFADPAALAGWRAIDDVVMGGVSSSTFAPTAGGALFSGTVSLERGGGFASARSADGAWDLRGARALELELLGDGKLYQCNLRTDAASDGVVYRARFPTEADRLATVTLPFERFEPSFRGRAVAGAPPLDLARVASFGFLISAQQAGPFRLELRRIAASPAT